MFCVKIVVGFESVMTVCKICVKVLVNLFDFMIDFIAVIKFIQFMYNIFIVYFYVMKAKHNDI